MAAAVGDLKLAKLLRKYQPNAIVFYSYIKTMPLHLAINQEDTDMVRMLVKYQPDQANASAIKPLLLAVDSNLIEIAKILLKAGADPDAPTWLRRAGRNTGRFALSHYNKHLQVLKPA